MTIHRPGLNRQLQWLDRSSVVVSLLAAITEVVILLIAGSEPTLYLGLGVTVLGVFIARPHPALGIIVVALGPMVATIVQGDPLVLWTIVVFTAFSVALRGLPGIVVGLLAGAAAFTAVVLHDGYGVLNATAFTALAMAFTAAASGSALRNYDRYRSELVQRAEDAIASRESEAERRVAQERVRIARDLHDIVGHEVAVLGIHLGVAEVGLPAGSGASKDAIEAARRSVQSILIETQRILRVLRADEPDEVGSPAPDYPGITRVIDSFRSAGLTVQSEIADAPAMIDPEVSTAAYRIVQEALTNAQRHGDGAVQLTISIGETTMAITASNEIPPAGAESSNGTGLGIVGMKERASSAGGRLTVHQDDTRFSVMVTMRLDGGKLS
ncbi:hypothetical protein KZC52_07145 [Microbacterium sp. kSW2-24]|uniref:sensor histidine kinase n=1 Tax=Microbacterium galbinum TaxID=2851646 RepID=UPI001FFD3419|nr:histidine kinase [Microbacterium galbinum]MCK2022693.1 hypothetical protein [Microbacterium galbinum]